MKLCHTCQQTYSDETEFCPHDGARLAAQVTETEAQLAAGLSRRFRILRRLGAGGMGAVFLAEQIGVGNRPVALKVLNRKLLDDAEFLLRFQNEAGSTGRIRHTNVVTIFESAQADDGTPYIAMEFLEGESLREALQRRRVLPVTEVAEILQQTARGLNAAHKLGIIHRDLKPDNIFLTRGDEGEMIVKVVDFGIAKLRESSAHTQTGMVLGTPAYMSYEQASGMRSDELDARSDVYSLGVVVYEMLTGRAPFHSDTPVGYLRKHLMEEPPPFRAVAPGLSVTPVVENVVIKALIKDRAQRYASGIEFAREFVRAVSAPSPPQASHLPPTVVVEPSDRYLAEHERLASEKADAERREKEKAIAERAAKEKEEEENRARDEAEKKRLDAESAEERGRAHEREKAERDRLDRGSPQAEHTHKVGQEQPARDPQSSPIVASDLPFTICLTTFGDVATPLIAKGVRLPAEQSAVFSTVADNQNSVVIDVSLGPWHLAKDNVQIGKFRFAGIPPAPRGVPRISIKAVVDTALVLTVMAEDLATHREEVLDAVDLTRINIPASALVEPSAAPAVKESTKESPVNLGQKVEDAKRTGRSTSVAGIFKHILGMNSPDQTKPLPTNERGKDLRYDLEVSFEEAVLGCQPTIHYLGRDLQIKIPAGVKTGSRLRVKGMGGPGQSGAEAGDLYVVLAVREHPRYTRAGADLSCTVPISKAEAARGVTVEIPSLGTRPPQKLKVPAGTAAGTSFRVGGLGVPSLDDGNKFGDLYVIVETI